MIKLIKYATCIRQSEILLSVLFVAEAHLAETTQCDKEMLWKIGLNAESM